MPADGKWPPDEAIRARCCFASAVVILRKHSFYDNFRMSERSIFMEKNRILTTQRITRDAMLAAVCAVLGFIALDLGNVKVTFESLPVLLAGFMFGPIDGMLVGGVGTLVYQLLRYGISATTFLWMLPYIMCGLVVGLAAMKKANRTDPKRILLIIILVEIMILIVNTGVIYIDSKIYGYYSAAYVFGSLAIRIVICIIKSVVFGLVMPVLLKGLKAVNHIERNTDKAGQKR